MFENEEISRQHGFIEIPFDWDDCDEECQAEQNPQQQNGVGPFSCDACGKTFKLRVALRKHYLSHDDSRGKLSSSGKSVEPIKRKSARRILRYKVCSKALKKNDREPFECHICRRKFDQKKVLAAHIVSSHLEGRPFSCGICCKAFKQRHHLQEHLVVHSNNRPFKCDICGAAAYKLKSNLTKHMIGCRLKINEKLPLDETRIRLQRSSLPVEGRSSFSCNHCGSEFVCKSKLRAHVIVQCKNASFSRNAVTQDRARCPSCNEGFDQYDSLIEHAKNCKKYAVFVRQEEKKLDRFPIEQKDEYECGFCRLPFISAILLAEHLENIHDVKFFFHSCFKFGCENGGGLGVQVCV